MTTSIASMLAPDGPVARRLGSDFEARPQQLRMAEAVARTLDARGVLLVEAGTGVGKSFAYLLPAIRRAVEKRERVVIATNTIALQEQLLEKDIPLLRAAMPEEFTAVLVKGRGNYVSVRRLELASRKQDRLFADEAARRTLHTIEDWAYDTTDGTLATLPQLERPAVWDRVQSDAGNCMGRRCPRYDRCFFQQARRRMDHADLLICNHALYFSDLALRQQGVGFLPEYGHVILDEAHCAEDVATEHFGLSLSEGRIGHLLSLLHQPRTGKGFLPSMAPAADQDMLNRALAAVDEADGAARACFDGVADLAMRRDSGKRGEGGEFTLRLREPNPVENTITPAFEALTILLKRLREEASNDEERFELNSYIERAQVIGVTAEALLSQSVEGCAYWAEVKRTEAQGRLAGGGGARITLACSPIDVAPILRKALFEEDLSVVLTSATLTTGRSSFEHVASRLGCDLDRDDVETMALGSPFDLATQVEFIVDRTMPDPREQRYVDELSRKIVEHVKATGGGAFVLFTSFATLRAVDGRIRDVLEALGYPVWAQGRDGARSLLLQRFREHGSGVLLGAASFWQGVDVRGEALRNVIITRLPFEPPDRPLTEARHERIAQEGGNAFMHDTLPRAIIRFRQGVGRLIRSAGDSGRVVVLDPRIVTKAYGRGFRDAFVHDDV